MLDGGRASEASGAHAPAAAALQLMCSLLHRAHGADVYAFAMVVYEVLSRRSPFQDLDPALLPSVVREGKRPQLPMRPAARAMEDGALGKLVGLMEACWAAAPAARPMFGNVAWALSELEGACADVAAAAGSKGKPAA